MVLLANLSAIQYRFASKLWKTNDYVFITSKAQPQDNMSKSEENYCVQEPTSANWGGKWTSQKLDAFVAYVKAYLTIMKNNAYWKTIYFDGFAGSGKILKEPSKTRLPELFIDESTYPDIELYKGSVHRILSLNQFKFNYYYFIDKSAENIKSIKSLASEIEHIDERRIVARCADCNEQLMKLSTVLKKKKHVALIFLDPFGMQVNWRSIYSLKGTRSDIWILIPSGVAINRLLPKSGVVKHKSKLEKFFGIGFDQLYSCFYDEKIESTFFGRKKVTIKSDHPIERVAALYIVQLESIWKYVTQEPLVLKNSKNVPIFHLLFASNNKSALKIASQIIGSKQK